MPCKAAFTFLHNVSMNAEEKKINSNKKGFGKTSQEECHLSQPPRMNRYFTVYRVKEHISSKCRTVAICRSCFGKQLEYSKRKV